MSRRLPPSEQAAESAGPGCLTGIMLPPLAVLCVSVLLVFLLLGSTTPGAPVAQAAMTDLTPAEATSSSAPLLPLSSVFTPEVLYWSDEIRAWSAAAGLDPNLAATVMQIESCGDPRALSRAGAMGLFQVMPYHFASGENPYDPDTNAFRGLDYLRRSLETAGGDARLAFAGYNGGIGVIGKSEFNWAAETQRYAYWGSGIYAEASSGADESLRLEEWLQAGGASLCKTARSRLGINP